MRPIVRLLRCPRNSQHPVLSRCFLLFALSAGTPDCRILMPPATTASTVASTNRPRPPPRPPFVSARPSRRLNFSEKSPGPGFVASPSLIFFGQLTRLFGRHLPLTHFPPSRPPFSPTELPPLPRTSPLSYCRAPACVPLPAFFSAALRLPRSLPPRLRPSLLPRSPDPSGNVKSALSPLASPLFTKARPRTLSTSGSPRSRPQKLSTAPASPIASCATSPASLPTPAAYTLSPPALPGPFLCPCPTYGQPFHRPALNHFCRSLAFAQFSCLCSSSPLPSPPLILAAARFIASKSPLPFPPVSALSCVASSKSSISPALSANLTSTPPFAAR